MPYLHDNVFVTCQVTMYDMVGNRKQKVKSFSVGCIWLSQHSQHAYEQFNRSDKSWRSKHTHTYTPGPSSYPTAQCQVQIHSSASISHRHRHTVKGMWKTHHLLYTTLWTQLSLSISLHACLQIFIIKSFPFLFPFWIFALSLLSLLFSFQFYVLWLSLLGKALIKVKWVRE